MFLRWLIFIHVLSAITFFLGHGAAAAMAFQLRKETSLERIQAMLDLSVAPLMVYLYAFLIMGITGLWMPFVLKIWNQYWIWASIVLMVFVMIWMGMFNNKTYKPLRKLVGLPYMEGNKQFPAVEPASEDEIIAHIRGIRLRGLVIIGYGLPMVVLWLMVFKPG